MAGTNEDRGPFVRSKHVQQVGTVLRKIRTALAIMQVSNQPERDLPDSPQPIGRASQQEEKEEDAGKDVSQHAQQREQNGFSHYDNYRDVVFFQTAVVLIVF